MNFNVAILGLVEIISAITIGVFILSLTYKILQYVGRKFYDIQEENLAYSIFTAAIIFSTGYMVSGVLQPLSSSFRLLDPETSGTFMLTLKFILQGATYIAIAYVAAMAIGLLSAILYSKLTPIDEFEEMKKNNLGVAIIVSSIVITLTLLTKSGVELLIESIIPYPTLPPK